MWNLKCEVEEGDYKSELTPGGKQTKQNPGKAISRAYPMKKVVSSSQCKVRHAGVSPLPDFLLSTVRPELHILEAAETAGS